MGINLTANDNHVFITHKSSDFTYVLIDELKKDDYVLIEV